MRFTFLLSVVRLLKRRPEGRKVTRSVCDCLLTPDWHKALGVNSAAIALTPNGYRHFFVVMGLAVQALAN